MSRLDDSDHAVAVFGTTHADTHYKFVAGVTWNIILNNVPKEEHKKRLDEIGMAILSNLMGAVDAVLSAYAEARGSV